MTARSRLVPRALGRTDLFHPTGILEPLKRNPKHTRTPTGSADLRVLASSTQTKSKKNFIQPGTGKRHSLNRIILTAVSCKLIAPIASTPPPQPPPPPPPRDRPPNIYGSLSTTPISGLKVPLAPPVPLVLLSASSSPGLLKLSVSHSFAESNRSAPQCTAQTPRARL